MPLIEHTPGTRLESVDAFADHLVVSLRRDGLTGLRVLAGGSDRRRTTSTFPEPLYSVGLDANPEYDTDVAPAALRLAGHARTRSTTTTWSPGELVLRKRKPVLRAGRRLRPGRLRAAPRVGARRRRHPGADLAGLPARHAARRLGALRALRLRLVRGQSMDPWFSIPRLSLLDRGVVFAVAHVRGGGEMGRRWYDDGKLLAKKNTFTDFVACARHLVKAGWTSPDRLVARGGSAGGLLMGAVANLAPDAFAGIVAQVPFVDALNSILDPSLPLTVTEWEEWGNPLDDPEVYAYMKSYTPYENVADVDYPAILAVTSLNDTRVLYHEPAKWVARLRAVAPQGDYLLKTEMGAGHGGPSGRYDAWKEEAFIAAWILDRLGLSSIDDGRVHRGPGHRRQRQMISAVSKRTSRLAPAAYQPSGRSPR